MSSDIVLGSAFFTNYFAQFVYNVDTNLNTMSLTLAKSTVPGTYLGSQTADPSSNPIPTPSTPSVDPVVPIVDPTPTLSNSTDPTTDTTGSGGMSGTQILYLMIELFCAIVLFAIIVYMARKKNPCGRKKQFDDNDTLLAHVPYDP